jgi:hypothetical protein
MRTIFCLLLLAGCPPEEDQKKSVQSGPADLGGPADLARPPDLVSAGGSDGSTTVISNPNGIFCTMDGVPTELRREDYQGAGNTYEIQYSGSSGGYTWVMFLRAPISGSDTCNGSTGTAIHLVRWSGNVDDLWITEPVGPPAGPAIGECNFYVSAPYMAGGMGQFEATFDGRVVRTDGNVTPADIRLTNCTVRDTYYF